MIVAMKRLKRPLTDAELKANRDALEEGSPPPFVQDLGRVADMGWGLCPGKTLEPAARARPTLTTGDRHLADPPKSLKG